MTNELTQEEMKTAWDLKLMKIRDIDPNRDYESYEGVCKINKKHRFHVDSLGRGCTRACCGHPIDYKKAFNAPKLNAKKEGKQDDKSTE